MEKENRYEIGGKTYVMRPIVLGQWRQLLKALQGTKIPVTNDILVLIDALADKIPELLAIVLREEGIPLQSKDMDKMAVDLDFSIEPNQLLTVIDDFFSGNEISSFLNEISTRIMGSMEKVIEISSKNSASPSPAETSPSEIASSGLLS